MEDICLETVWENKLKYHGWSNRAIMQLPLCLAASTLNQYNMYIRAFRDFCRSRGHSFPPDDNASAVTADYLCLVADSTQRPEPKLRVAIAALTHLFDGYELDCPLRNYDMKMLRMALVKSGTKKSAHRTKSMPAAPFYAMFKNWDDNEILCIRDLRLKAITLMSLVFMARPSDIAPRGVTFHKDTETTELVSFSVDNLEFHSDNSMTVHFFAIKNDSNRSGFEVRIPGSNNDKTDVVKCVQSYINRTQEHRARLVGKPLFLSLKPPFRGIKAETVGRILSEAIASAGLSDQGYTPKCFRPTGANAAIEAGIMPETAMQIGRWKTKEVFYNHYVYPRAPGSYTDDIQTFSGVDYK